MDELDRMYLGTWQLSGQFKQLSTTQIESLLRFAIDVGIRRFDTAPVYGEGLVEKLLGRYLPKDAIIVTKIPAITKPNLKNASPIKRYYDQKIIFNSAINSLKRLRRNCVDTILLHNWMPYWESDDAIEILSNLEELKKQGITRRIGISLPNDFIHSIDLKILSYIDVIEAPFNPEQRWIAIQIPQLLKLKKEILLRSIFCQGKLISDRNSAQVFLGKALKLKTSVVVGASTKKQIYQNVKTLKRGDYR